MPKHLYLFLLLTFLMGLLGGVYIYFLTRTPDTEPRPSSNVTERGYEIVATTYGGCERIGCASLRIQDDGSYTYLIGGQDNTYSRYEDSLSMSQTETLTDLIAETPFNAVIISEFKGTCPITYDGLAYRFTIVYEGITYDMDSCVMALHTFPVFEEITKYFDIMSATYDSP